MAKESMSKLNVYNLSGKEVGTLDLPAAFGEAVNPAVIHQAIVMYQANQRQGTADTRTRAEISGGNKKPFRQKGTGRARQGSSRSPLMHHGGIVFGPHPRDFSYTIPKKVRLSALLESLKDKFGSSSLICVDDLVVDSAKTKDFVAVLANLKLSGKKILAVSDDSKESFKLAARNVRSVQLIRSLDVNAFDVMKNNTILATKAAMEKILKRLQ